MTALGFEAQRTQAIGAALPAVTLNGLYNRNLDKTKAFLGGLEHKSDVPAHLQQAAGIFLGLGRQLIVILDGNLFGKQEAKIVQVVPSKYYKY